MSKLYVEVTRTLPDDDEEIICTVVEFCSEHVVGSVFNHYVEDIRPEFPGQVLNSSERDQALAYFYDNLSECDDIALDDLHKLGVPTKARATLRINHVRT